MKSIVALLAAGFLAFTGVLTYAQTQEPKGKELLRVRRNVLITDTAGAMLGEQKAEDVKLWEDGAEQVVTSLSYNSSPLYLEIVLDDSGSMAPFKTVMADAAKFLVEGLEESSKVQIVRFSSGVRIANGWADDKPFLLKALSDDMGRGGSSPIFDGVGTALDQIKLIKSEAADKRFAVVLISDCMEGGSSRKLNELMDEMKEVDVAVFTIMLTPPIKRPDTPDPRFEEPLQRFEKLPHELALQSGGSVYFPTKGENAKLPISETLKGLAAELRSQFVLTYIPANQARDDKERHLRIEFAEKYDGINRTGAIKETHVITQLK